MTLTLRKLAVIVKAQIVIAAHRQKTHGNETLTDGPAGTAEMITKKQRYSFQNK